MFGSRFMPCIDCGASLDRYGGEHECDLERQLDFRLFALRDEIAGFEGQLRDWLRTPRGRFEAYDAARRRR